MKISKRIDAFFKSISVLFVLLAVFVGGKLFSLGLNNLSDIIDFRSRQPVTELKIGELISIIFFVTGIYILTNVFQYLGGKEEENKKEENKDL